jgi:hypothetical protein
MHGPFLAVAVVGVIVVLWLLIRGRFLTMRQQQMIGHIGTTGSSAEQLEVRFGKGYQATLASLIDQGYVEARAASLEETVAPLSEGRAPDESPVRYHLTRAGETALIYP